LLSLSDSSSGVHTFDSHAPEIESGDPGTPHRCHRLSRISHPSGLPVSGPSVLCEQSPICYLASGDPYPEAATGPEHGSVGFRIDVVKHRRDHCCSIWYYIKQCLTASLRLFQTLDLRILARTSWNVVQSRGVSINSSILPHPPRCNR